MPDHPRDPLPKPETPLQACLMAGERASSENRWADGVKWFAKAKEFAPANNEIAGKLGFCLSRNKEYQQAIEVYTALSTSEPQVARWPYAVGFQYYELGQWDEALHWFDRALSIRPAYLIVLYRKGYAHLRKEQAGEAEQAWKTCVALWERLSLEAQREKRKCYSDACFQLGKLYLQQRFTLKARKYLKRAVENDPTEGDKRYELGKCLLELRLATEAVQELRQANTLHPGKDYIIDRLARAHIEVGDLAEADRLYASIPPARWREHILRSLGILRYKQGRYEEAIKHLVQAITKEPRNHHSQYHLGLAYEAAGKLIKARQAYRQAIRLRQQFYHLSYSEAEERLQALEKRIADQQIVEEPPVSLIMSGEEQIGKIVYYDRQRGYGFIRDEAGERIFFHVRDLPVNFVAMEGEEVTYEVRDSPKGLKAIHILLRKRGA